MNPFDDKTDPALRNQILTYKLSEFMTDRERAQLLGLPEGCRIREHAKILAPEKFKCGHHVWIGEGAILDAQGGLEIGNYTQVGLSVMVWTHSSHNQALQSQTCFSREGITYKPTKIGNNCFIAGPSVIGAGVTIGDRVIISPLSFVDRDLPDGTVYSNNRFRKQQDKNFEELKAITAQLASLVLRSGTVAQDEVKQLIQRLESLGK